METILTVQDSGPHREKLAIRLEGKWLKEAGFRKGMKVKVSAGDGAIQIEQQTAPDP